MFLRNIQALFFLVHYRTSFDVVYFDMTFSNAFSRMQTLQQYWN